MRGKIAGVLLIAGLAVWRLTHPKAQPWGNRWGEPLE